MDVKSEDKINSDIMEMLTLQLSEVEMLSSMYPIEFKLDDELSVEEIRQRLDGVFNYATLSSRIGFTVQITLDNKDTLEMVCHLPHEYPSVRPEVFIRSPSLPRTQHRQLSEELHSFIAEQDLGELCMASTIQWIQENAGTFTTALEDLSESVNTKSVLEPKKQFSRMWIYSHHIYSKIKRKDILDFSDELNLTGFSMPGKPGIIVIEGESSDVEEFWHRIRRMQWKKLTMKEKEDFDVGDKNIDDLRKFTNFEEKYFEPRQGKGRGAHADRGLLFKFLEKKGCGHIFQLYFGVDGKGAEESD